jgi:hypothetical protein
VEGADPILQRAVALGHPLVVAQMVAPGGLEEALEVALGLSGVLEQAPGAGAVTAALAGELIAT